MGEISTFGLELFSSSQIFYKGRARFINLPATDGGSAIRRWKSVSCIFAVIMMHLITADIL